MRRFFIVFLFTIGLLYAADDPLSLADEAVRNNPEMEMLARRVKSIQSEIDGSSVWKDPMLMLEYSSMPIEKPYPGNHAMSGIQVKLQQTFPFPGKNDSREAVSIHKERVVLAEIEEWKNILRSKVREAYWRLAASRIFKDLLNRQLDRLNELKAAVRAGVESGRNSSYSLIRIETMTEKLREELYGFESEDRILTAQINSARGVEIERVIETPSEIPKNSEIAERKSLLKTALERRPLIKVWREKAELERAAAEKIENEGLPDITAWAGYRFRKESGMDEGVDFITLGISIPIPFDYTGGVNSRKSARKYSALAAEGRVKSISNDIGFSLEKALATLERFMKRIEKYRNVIIPGAERELKSAIALYVSGGAGFEPLYQSQINLIMLERQLVMAELKIKIERIKIDMITGGIEK